MALKIKVKISEPATDEEISATFEHIHIIVQLTSLERKTWSTT